MNYSARSIRLTKEEYDYMLTVCRPQLLHRIEADGSETWHYVALSMAHFEDFINRMQGVHGLFDALPHKLVADCFIAASIVPFRKHFGLETPYLKDTEQQ